MRRIQMIGTQRSGSNLLRQMLGESPEIFAPPSTHLLSVFAPVLDTYGDLRSSGPGRALLADVVELVRRNVLQWPEGLPDSSLLAARPIGSAADLQFAVYDTSALSMGCTAWVCKSLENFDYLQEMLRSDPTLIALHLLRDGRDVALSFREAPIGPKHPRIAARKWKEEQAAIEDFRREFPGSIVTTKYEDLIEDPLGVILALHKRLGTSDPGDPLAYFRSDTAIAAPRLSELWQNLDQPVISTNSGRYLLTENRAFVEEFEAVAGDALETYGYQRVTDTEPTDRDPSSWQTFERVDAELRRLARAEADPDREAPHARYEEFCARIRARRT